ncbi:MAG: molybdate ABC transporter permease subunit [Lachnospiraceae bacterium]|nr:molybdate ABC transporter permease subunit [Lachnospiraceae bacterium]
MDFDLSPLWISLKTATVSTVFTFFFGILLARLIYPVKRFRFLIDSLLYLPMVLPPTVVGFFLLIVFGKNSALGGFLASMGINVVFTWQGAVVAAVVVSFPIMYITTMGAFEQMDTELIDAAKTLGFSDTAIFFKVWIPLCWPGIAAGTTLSFARALGEFGATIMIAGNLPGKTRTMSTAVYSAMQGGNREMAYKWVVIIMFISICTLVLMNFLSSRKYTRDERRQSVAKRIGLFGRM